MFELYKNKWFWIVLIILSTTGAIIGFVLSWKHNKKLEQAERIELRDYYNPGNIYIHGIEDTTLVDQYIKFEMDNVYPKPLTFKSTAIRTDERLYALDYTQDSSLVLVARENDNPTMQDPSYMELWVWRKHVKWKK